MGTSITCPSCRHQFVMEDAFAADIEKEMRGKMEGEWRKRLKALQEEKDTLQSEKDRMTQERRQIDLLKQQQEEEVTKRVLAEKKRLQENLEAELRKSITADLDNQLAILKEANLEQEEKLKEARKHELEFLRKEQELKAREQELEIDLQKKLLEARSELADKIRREEAERNALKDTEYHMRLRELEKQLDDQRKLAEEMKRKAEQGSTQLQGEAQELVLEEMLRTHFPFDEITPVGKGVRGADCIQLVRNQYGQECGRIIYESKRTKEFTRDWVEKLKADMRSQGVEVAILVTQTMPKDMERFGEKDGVWICTFAEAKALAHVLRDGIIKISSKLRSQENKGDKMHMLYEYLTGGEFAEQWKAIREGFMAMKLSIQRERDAMEKLWKAREKQLEKVLLNAAHIRGSIEGIAGSDSVDLQLLEDAADELLD
ncbi:DUF2130 domain-containing protein [Chitinophaga polysaccharea]|uniref:DUF2130 domain-containing protein n=1 Tax=Chitinophaga TaxID=79328 RepID=UPI001455ABAA|nr:MULTISPECIES: DUF2130 domain-containing protein [Chitinophaga]NLR61338.1 DUF2130 domain-containing protein [Chitinophaga polysaccharea]NLU95174.1 DUF2130 domain-containing protein [Chitinophaga sp. Ak27]